MLPLRCGQEVTCTASVAEPRSCSCRGRADRVLGPSHQPGRGVGRGSGGRPQLWPGLGDVSTPGPSASVLRLCAQRPRGRTWGTTRRRGCSADTAAPPTPPVVVGSNPGALRRGAGAPAPSVSYFETEPRQIARLALNVAILLLQPPSLG